MTVSPTTPPGVLELLPAEQAIHDAMLDTIRSGYRRFGFVPIETPVFERTDVLLTKSGGETERQVYFVQSAGSREQGADPDLALRFDLTVPLARYVAEHEHDLVFPFRRSQIQRVYRGERPQKGRYREFYQCDIDVIDRDQLSLHHDAEVAAAMVSILTDLGIGDVTMRLNNRRLMRSILEHGGIADADDQTRALREIDKLEKVGIDGVAAGLDRLGLGGFRDSLGLISQRATGAEAILELLASLPGAVGESQGAAEMTSVVRTMESMGVPGERYALDLSVARGLDYYTGTVYETTLDSHPELGSICSGGRYDDLASQYTSTRLPGVGLSIGFTRLFWQLREAGLLPTSTGAASVAITLLDEAGLAYNLAIAQRLRSAGFDTETALTPSKLGRQLKNADRAGRAFAVIAGEDERRDETATVKHLATGEQAEVALDDLVAYIRTYEETPR